MFHRTICIKYDGVVFNLMIKGEALETISQETKEKTREILA